STLRQAQGEREKGKAPGPALGGREKGQAPSPARPELVEGPPLGILLAMALPDNLARRRDGSGESWLSAGGRGYALDPVSPLATAEWLAIGDAQGQAKGARITAALPLATDEVERWLAGRVERCATLRWTGERVEARLE